MKTTASLTLLATAARRFRRAAAAAACLVVASGCAGDVPAQPLAPTASDGVRTSDEAPETAVQSGPRSSLELASLPYPNAVTSPELAARNLEATVQSAEARAAAVASAGSLAALADALTTRAQFSGSNSDAEQALEAARRAVDRHPDDPTAHRAHASALGALHEFELASRALHAAAEHGANTERDALGIALAQGLRVDEAVREFGLESEQWPTFASLADSAGALAAAGAFDAADAEFVRALEAYRDVSPYPVAWTQFQRGVMWGEAAGRSDLAEALYRDAVRLVPSYVVANVHLAEIEADQGSIDAAIARLRSVAHGEDPEPWSRLSEYLAESDPAAARSARERASDGYEALLEEHRLAYADHGAEFYLGSGGDAERGLMLAIENLDSRATPRAFELAIGAARQVGDLELACRLVERVHSPRNREGLIRHLDDLSRCEG